jgi:ABC-type glycerol-3-phosphate transport system substrate-binding protein
MKARKVIFSVFLIFILGAFQLKGCGGGDASISSECEGLRKEDYDLTYWRVWEDQTMMDEIIKMYEERNPEANIRVVTKDASTIYEEYEQSLINGTPPDLISIRNDWFADLAPKLQPTDPSLWGQDVMDRVLEKNDLYSRCGLEPKINNLEAIISPTEVRRNFSSTIYNDLVVKGRVLGVSLYVQPLVLYYNKDLFQSANPPILEPPKTWEELRDYSRRITRDVNGRRPGEIGFNPNNLSVAGAALGYNSSTINRATDILSAMLMQAGINMVNRSATVPTFNQSTTPITPEYVLDLYTSFADPNSSNYSYSVLFNNSSGADQAFRDGKIGMIINYPHKLQGGELGYWDASRSINFETGRVPRFELGVSEVPRFAQNGIDLTYSSYFAEAVTSRNRIKESWDFLRFVSSIDFDEYTHSPAYVFASRTNLPTAIISDGFLKEQQDLVFSRFSSRINLETGEPLLKVAIQETLESQSYQKRSYKDFESKIDDMILSVNLFKNPFAVSDRFGVVSLPIGDAIDKAIQEIAQISN